MKMIIRILGIVLAIYLGGMVLVWLLRLALIIGAMFWAFIF